MTTSFRCPFTVVKRNMGVWQNGVYVVDEDMGQQQTVMATVQTLSERERNMIETYPYGRRDSRNIKIYCDEKLQPVSQKVNTGEIAYPGDLFLFDGRTYLIFGEDNFTMLSRTRSTNVSHWRYYACEIIEGASAEGAP